MNTDEKNKFSSTNLDFDPNFARKDKYETAKEDKQFMKGHKRSIPSQPEARIQHDPYNVTLNDPGRKNRKHGETLEMDGSDLNREESPTNRDMHHLYVPDAKVRQPKDKPHKLKHNKFIEMPGGEKKEVKREKKDTEVLKPKGMQSHGKINYKS